MQVDGPPKKKSRPKKIWMEVIMIDLNEVKPIQGSDLRYWNGETKFT